MNGVKPHIFHKYKDHKTNFIYRLQRKPACETKQKGQTI